MNLAADLVVFRLPKLDEIRLKEGRIPYALMGPHFTCKA